MPRHLELIESCASCLPHGNSVSSVACDLLYKTTNLFFSLLLWFNFLFSTEDTEVTDYFSVFCVLRGLILFSTEDTEFTDYFQCFLFAPWFNFIFHGRHESHGLFSVFSVCSVV